MTPSSPPWTPLPLLALVGLALGGTASGCGSSGGLEVVLAPAATANGLEGDRGPHGVARERGWAQARISEGVSLELCWPALTDGSLDPAGAPYPAVLLVNGGLVRPERYRWLAEHVASRGYVVVAPRHRLNLAILVSDNASWALDELHRRVGDPGDPLAGAVDPEAPVVAMGHSLGAVVSAMRWVADERVEAVAQFAGYAPGSVSVEEMAGFPSLLLTGARDQVPPEEFVAQYARYPEPRFFGIVEGMNHYDWTDDPLRSELKGDGQSTRPAAESRKDALRVLDSWMDAWLLEEPGAIDRLDRRAFAGVEVRP